MKIGIIGLGAIGSELCEFIDSSVPNAKLECVCDIDSEKIKATIQKLKTKPRIVGLQQVIESSDLIIEAANKEAAFEVAKLSLKYNKDVLLMSIGVILEYPELSYEFKTSNSKLYLPSGAIGSLDALKAAVIGGITKVKLITTKGKNGLKDALYVVNNKINIDVKHKTTIFTGNAIEAIKGFPKNVNVAAVLALAGIGAEKTEVEIVLDPNSTKNVHEIFVEGGFGKYSFKVENLPSQKNPKTSYLAVLSAKAMLKQITSNVRVGT